MKKRFWLGCMLAMALSGYAMAQADTGNAVSDFDIKLETIEKAYNETKTKISSEFPKIDKQFFPLADSTFSYVKYAGFSQEKVITYTTTLQKFLSILYQNANNEDIALGKFNDGFKYFLLLTEWDNKNVLEQNIRIYRKFTLGYASLIPDEKICEKFIIDYARDNPNEVLKNAAQFGQQAFAIELMDKIALEAPNLIKRYLYTENEVSSNIKRSKSPASRYLISVYKNYGLRTNAYLLAYNVLKNEFSMNDADSIGKNNQTLFKMLVRNMKQPDVIGGNSVFQSLEEYAVEQTRKGNEIAIDATGYAVAEYFKQFNAEEIFTLLVYGHKELSVQGLNSLLIATKNKTYAPFTIDFISSINTAKLKSFLAFCEKNGKLDAVLQLMHGKSLNYLYQLMSQNENSNLLSQFDVVDSADIQELFRTRLAEITLSKSLPKPTKSARDQDPTPTVITKDNDLPAENEMSGSMMKASETAADDFIDQSEHGAEAVKPIKLNLSERERALLSLKKNIINTLKNIPDFINKSYAEDVLVYAAQHEPDEIFKRFESFKSKYFATKVLEVAGKAAPTSMKRYIYNSTHPVALLFKNSTDSVIQQIMKMPNQVGYPSKAYILMDAIVKKRLSPSQADNICKSPQCMFKELVKTAEQKEYIGRYSVERELTDFSLRFLREINDNIALNEKEPFRIVEDFTEDEIYFLMVYGREEVITSSFNGLYNQLQAQMKNNNVQTLLAKVNKNHFRIFISMCSTYNKLDEIMSALNAEQQRKLLVEFMHLSNNENNNDGVEIAEAIASIKNPNLLAIIHSQIKAEYQNAEKNGNNTLLALYGVLASLVDGHALVDKDWFNTLSKQIKLPAVSQLPAKSLIAEEQRCIEQMYFYNDIDGRESFSNFLSTFKVLPTWKVEDRGSYVLVKSTEGNVVEIYANKPEYETNGQDAINDYFKENKIYPMVVIHRGHSFHTAATLEKIDEHVKLLLVGSCGGFYKLSEAIDNAPYAHIISTKQIGTKNINDPVLLSLNEYIRTGKNIVWKDFWEQMRQKLGSNPYFADYIPPHQNLKSLFSRAYFSLLGV